MCSYGCFGLFFGCCCQLIPFTTCTKHVLLLSNIVSGNVDIVPAICLSELLFSSHCYYFAHHPARFIAFSHCRLLSNISLIHPYVMSDFPPPDSESVDVVDSTSPQAIDNDGAAASLASPTTHSTPYSSRPPPVSSYYSSDDPHHSLMEASYVKATSSPQLSPQPSRMLRKCILGIAAMDKKTRSKPMTQSSTASAPT